ncbi:hypothetical protein AVEN_122150-1 [Araneus ventricosus]|uniref:Uncharacterized protein n=1 Tax=Araneus ventricosus TaxID=182803 RepID=A0A4Y2I9G8_ARAVE|nr:hypothetical protein AVEN_122150-1 [Araneus ventricosus]
MDKEVKSGLSMKNHSELSNKSKSANDNNSSTAVTDQSTDINLKAPSGDAQPEKKARPPPIDVSAAQELQQQAMAGPKTPTSASPVTPGVVDHRKAKKRKIGHRRINEEGRITYKKIETSQIMGSIQLGISIAISSLASKPERDLLIQDFTIVETITFPKLVIIYNF